MLISINLWSEYRSQNKSRATSVSCLLTDYKVGDDELRIYFVLLAAIVLNAGANIMIKAAMRKTPIILEHGALLQTIIQVLKNPLLITGVGLFGLALAAYSIVLSKINLSIAYPIMTGAGFLLVFLASAAFFKESIAPVHVIGAGLILAGVWILVK